MAGQKSARASEQSSTVYSVACRNGQVSHGLHLPSIDPWSYDRRTADVYGELKELLPVFFFSVASERVQPRAQMMTVSLTGSGQVAPAFSL